MVSKLFQGSAYFSYSIWANCSAEFPGLAGANVAFVTCSENKGGAICLKEFTRTVLSAAVNGMS